MRASLIKRNSILKKNLVNNVNRKQTLITNHSDVCAMSNS